MLQLRPYQIEAVRAVQAAPGKPLVALPTGTGKTLCFSQLIKERGGRALILAHRDELLQQAEEKLRLVWPEVPSIGVVKAERNETGAQVILGSVQTLRNGRLSQFPPGTFNTLVIDEAHHAGAPSYQKVIEHLQAPLTVGFTATPERLDRKPLGFDRIVYQKGLFEMIAAQYLCDIKAKQISIRKLDLGGVKTSAGDYQEGALGEAMEDAAAPEIIAEALEKYAAGRPTIVFTPTVAMAHKVEAVTGFEIVHGEQSSEDRRAVLAGFKAGKVRGVVNCGVLLEGYDEPSVSCVAVARPTKSRVLYQQMIGRGTRLHPGKEDLLVLDFVGATLEHDLVTLAQLLQVKPSTAEAGVSAVIEQARAAHPEIQKALAGEVVAATVDLVTRRRLHWIQDGSRFLLSAGLETLALVPSAGLWDVRSIPRGAEPSRKVFAGLSLEYAQGAAEDYIRKLGVEVLANSGARWRQAPATQAQLTRMRECGIPHQPGITKGEASDLMTRFFNRRKW